MKPRTLIIYLVVLSLAIGYYVYFEVYKTRQAQSQEEQNAKVFALPKQAIDTLIITRKERIELTRQNNQWMITAPVKEQSDARTLAAILDTLLTLKRQRDLKGFTDQSVFAKALTISFRAAGQNYSLTIGSQTPTKEFRYARASNHSGVFLIQDVDVAALDKDLLALRDKRLFSLALEGIDTISLSGKILNIKMVKDNKAGWHIPGQDLKLSDAKVQGLLQQIWWQEATLFADGMSIGSAPLMEITLADKQTTQALKIWQVGKALFAKSTLHPQVVEIDRMFMESLPRDTGMLAQKGERS